MKFNFDNVRVYRQTAPDAEGHGGGGGKAPEEVEEPTSGADSPEDTGDDTIPQESNFWDALDEEFDAEDSDEAVPSKSPAVEETPQPPAESEESVPAEPEPEPDIQPTPSEQPTETVTPEETPPVETPSEEEVIAQRTKQRDEFTQRIKEHYALSEEEKLQMVTDPGAGFLNVMSRMYADMWYGFQQLVQQQMPTLVETGLKEVEERNSYVDKFFAAWPKLNRKEHGKTVSEVARVYAQTNPNATEEQVVKFVGMQTMLMHGIAPEMTPTEPQSPALSTPPIATPQTPPYRPPAVNGSPPPQARPTNEWEAYAEELLEDDANY